MTIQDIIQDFKNHQLQHRLDGDSQMQELYKWKLVTDQIGHPDVNAVDFAKEINSLSLKNLCYSTQTTAIRHFAEYEPEVSNQSPPYSSAELFCLSLRDII